MAKKAIKTKKYRIKRTDAEDEIEEENDSEEYHEEVTPKSVLRTLKVIGILLIIASIFHGAITSKSANLPVTAKSLITGDTYTVKRGDSLWSIVQKKYKSENIESKIREIKQVNHLKDDTVKVGEVLHLP